MAMLVFAAITSFLPAAPADVEEYAARLRSFGIREDGSPGEREAFNFIAERLEELGIEFSRIPLGTGERGHSYSENIIARISGTVRGSYILAAPIDGGAYSAALLMDIAAELKIRPPKHDTIIVFLGAENGNSSFHPYGSRTAAALLENAGNQFALYLASDFIPRTWSLEIGGNGEVAPMWLINSVTQVFSSNFVPYSLRGTDFHVARLGLQQDIETLSPWIEAGIPAILLKGEGSIQDIDRTRSTKRLRDALSSLDAVMDGIPENRRSAFLFIRPTSEMRPRIIPELPFVAAFLAISAVLLLAVLSRYRAIILNLRRLAPYWWTMFLLYGLVFLFLFLGSLFTEETLLIMDFPTLWTHAPGTFIFFKLTIAAALSLNFIFLTRGLPLPRLPHYYSYASILTAWVASLVFIALDITMAIYPLWTVLMLLLLTATRNEKLKAFMLVLSIIPYLMVLAVIIREPYTGITESLLLDRVDTNLLLTLILMPVILAITSLNYWRSHYERIRRNVLTPTATLVLSISAILTLLWIVNIEPYGPGRPQPIELSDHIDLRTGNRRLGVSSPAPIGDAELVLDGITYSLENLGRKAEVRTPMNRTPLSLEQTSRSFLGRRIVTVTIHGEARPDALELELRSTSPFTLHQADYPFEMAPSGTSAEIFIGRHPPDPLEIRFTVNDDADLSLTCLATWLDPADPPEINRSNITASILRTARLETRF